MPERTSSCLASRCAPFCRLLVWLLLIVIVAWIFLRLSSLGMDYEWQWNRAWRYLGRWTDAGFQAGPLLEGIYLTLGISALGLVFSAGLGLFFAILRLSPWPGCILLAKAYVCALRNTPLLLQLFFVYFLIAPLLDMGPFWSAVLALSAFEGAYAAELFRGALLSVPAGQWEAAISLGFGIRQTLILVILPQAARNALPAITSQAISLIKDTSLVSAIAVADITMRAQSIVAETFLAFEVWLMAGFIYLVITLFIALPGIWLEKSWKWK